MTTCAHPKCQRDALVSSNPAVHFAFCGDHTDALAAAAFGASAPGHPGSG